MLRRLKRAYHFSRAQRLWLKGEVELALVCLQRLEALGGLPRFAEATRAVLFMQLGRIEDSDPLLDRLARETADSSDPDTVYINLFVRALRAAVDDRMALQQHLLREAKRLECSPYLKRWLPLAEPEALRHE